MSIRGLLSDVYPGEVVRGFAITVAVGKRLIRCGKREFHEELAEPCARKAPCVTAPLVAKTTEFGSLGRM